jgi:hypothetical protein
MTEPTKIPVRLDFMIAHNLSCDLLLRSSDHQRRGQKLFMRASCGKPYRLRVCRNETHALVSCTSRKILMEHTIHRHTMHPLELTFFFARSGALAARTIALALWPKWASGTASLRSPLSSSWRRLDGAGRSLCRLARAAVSLRLCPCLPFTA